MTVAETNKSQSQELATAEDVSSYQQLFGLADTVPFTQQLSLNHFTTKEDMAARGLNERLSASLQVLINMIANDGDKVGQIDKVLLDHYIAKLDEVIGTQLDEVLHHSEFQQCESVWKSLKYLVDNMNFNYNMKIEVLDIDKETLREDFEDAPDITQTGLYKHIYVQEYDTPGGEPISAIVSNYEFNAGAPDVTLLAELSKVAAAAHCPFLGSVGAKFFNKNNIDEVTKINDLSNYMERAEYVRWNGLRETEDARYLGLTLPRFLLRLPYGEQNPARDFCYVEQVKGETATDYLWGNASFALAANMARSFQKYGWTLNIRGPEAGGKVEQLPIHQYDVGRGLQTKIPTETIIPETRELEYANLGFIPLSYYKNSDFACFFSANSSQKPQEYSTPEATANSRINSRLPYIFLSSRLGHYLKVLQRENIGANKNRIELESELNGWIQSLVTKMNKPGPELAATHPLRDGKVTVDDVPDNPGFYKISMYAVPHFQIEGIDVRLSLVGKLPKGAAQQ
ncbi:MAG: type VI secretion system contractile sheath large subunit [Gammaproteobacteria bacterium]|nr:type VI secretion system contractile sheath large subunit [Gammaproteobacteria bacterium]